MLVALSSCVKHLQTLLHIPQERQWPQLRTTTLEYKVSCSEAWNWHLTMVCHPAHAKLGVASHMFPYCRLEICQLTSDCCKELASAHCLQIAERPEPGLD